MLKYAIVLKPLFYPDQCNPICVSLIIIDRFKTYHPFKFHMKHIGWCLDKIQMTCMSMPKKMDSEESKKKAAEVIDDIQKYADTLVNLVHNHKFEKQIHTLENTHIEGIKLQTKHIKELIKDLEHALYIIHLTLDELREMLKLDFTDKDNALKWKKSYDKLVVMIDQKFGGERGELREEFKVAVYTKKHLKEIVKSEKHLSEFLR